MDFVFINFWAFTKSQENLYIFQTKLFTARQPGREMIGQTENGSFTEPPHYMSHHTINNHISQNYHSTSHYNPNRQ